MLNILHQKKTIVIDIPFIAYIAVSLWPLTRKMIAYQCIEFLNPIHHYCFTKSFIVWFYLIYQEFFSYIQRELMPPLKIQQRKENLPI